MCYITFEAKHEKLEVNNMSFSFGLRDLLDPMKRLIMGVLLIALGIFCMIGKNWHLGDVACLPTEGNAFACVLMPRQFILLGHDGGKVDGYRGAIAGEEPEITRSIAREDAIHGMVVETVFLDQKVASLCVGAPILL